MSEFPTSMEIYFAIYIIQTCIRLHAHKLLAILEKKNTTRSSPKQTAIPRSIQRRIVVVGAIRSGIRRNSAANPLSGSVRFKIYRQRVWDLQFRQGETAELRPFVRESRAIASARGESASCINTLTDKARYEPVQLQS